jgi:hypothetical protein
MLCGTKKYLCFILWHIILMEACGILCLTVINCNYLIEKIENFHSPPINDSGRGL